jgi:hypothetical protein
MNLPGDYATLAGQPSRRAKALRISLALLVALGATGCLDTAPAPDPSATQTAVAVLNDRVMARYNADATAQAADPPATAVPTATTDACDVLTVEEVSAALGKPMEQMTFSKSGRCIYQGEAEFLLVTVYAGMTEEDARSLYNSKWANPNIPNGVQGGGMNRYSRERELTDLGDEAFLGATRPENATVRRAVFVRKGNKLFHLEWYTTVIDRDVSQVAIDLARKVLSRL